MPVISCLLRTNPVPLRFIEEVNDRLIRLQDHLPLVPVELALEVYHGPEGSATLELWRDPGIPVGYGGDGALEVDLVHLLGDAAIGTGAVGPIPEEAALFDNHFFLLVWGWGVNEKLVIIETDGKIG